MKLYLNIGYNNTHINLQRKDMSPIVTKLENSKYIQILMDIYTSNKIFQTKVDDIHVNN